MQILLLDRQKAKLALQGRRLIYRDVSVPVIQHVFFGGVVVSITIFFLSPSQKRTIHDVSLKYQIFEKNKRRLNEKSCVSKFVRAL